MSLDGMEKRNKSLRAQLDSLQRELASVRKSAARNGKKERLTDLQRVDQTSARLRKQNKDMRLQLESLTQQMDHLKHLKSQADDLGNQLENQEKENSALQRLLSHQAQGVAEQGPTPAQVKEMDRLKSASNDLQRDLRDAQHAAIEHGRKQQQQQLEYSRLCSRRERLQKALEEGESHQHRAQSTPTISSAAAAARKEAEHELALVRKARHGQQRRFQVRMHDLLAEIKELQTRLESHHLMLGEKDKLLGREPEPLPPPPVAIETTLAKAKATATVAAAPVGTPASAPVSPKSNSLGTLPPPSKTSANKSPQKERTSPGKLRSPEKPSSHTGSKEAGDDAGKKDAEMAAAASAVQAAARAAQARQRRAALRRCVIAIQAVSRGQRARRERAELKAAAEAAAQVRNPFNPFGGGKKKKGLFGGGGGFNPAAAKPALGVGAAAKPSFEPPASWRVNSDATAPTGAAAAPTPPPFTQPTKPMLGGVATIPVAPQPISSQPPPPPSAVTSTTPPLESQPPLYSQPVQRTQPNPNTFSERPAAVPAPAAQAPEPTLAPAAAAPQKPPNAPSAATQPFGRRGGRGRRMLDIEPESNAPTDRYVPSFGAPPPAEQKPQHTSFASAPAAEALPFGGSIRGVLAAAREETTSTVALGISGGYGGSGMGLGMGGGMGGGMGRPVAGRRAGGSMLGPNLSLGPFGSAEPKPFGSTPLGAIPTRNDTASETPPLFPSQSSNTTQPSAAPPPNSRFQPENVANNPSAGTGDSGPKLDRHAALDQSSYRAISSLDSIPSLSEKPASPGEGKAFRLADLKPPTFEDEIDDDALAAEEEAFLQRMKDKKQTAAPMPATVPDPAPEPELKRAPPAPIQSKAPVADAAPAAFLGPVGAISGGLDDDLSEEELD